MGFWWSAQHWTSNYSDFTARNPVLCFQPKRPWPDCRWSDQWIDFDVGSSSKFFNNSTFRQKEQKSKERDFLNTWAHTHNHKFSLRSLKCICWQHRSGAQKCVIAPQPSTGAAMVARKHRNWSQKYLPLPSSSST